MLSALTLMRFKILPFSPLYVEYITFGKLCQYICEVWQEKVKFGIEIADFDKPAIFYTASFPSMTRQMNVRFSS